MILLGGGVQDKVGKHVKSMNLITVSTGPARVIRPGRAATIKCESMEARAQAGPSSEPRSFEFVLPKVDEMTFGETHSQDTHNSGNTEGGGNDPRNTFAL